MRVVPEGTTPRITEEMITEVGESMLDFAKKHSSEGRVCHVVAVVLYLTKESGASLVISTGGQHNVIPLLESACALNQAACEILMMSAVQKGPVQ